MRYIATEVFQSTWHLSLWVFLLGLLDQVDEDQYIVIRERINDVFQVGEYQEFDSYMNNSH
ncbi:hypothetical protein NDJ00_12020 [Vibrio parahaemolyticus]|uniref:hypothetical protein n=1 Tax=Vibrio parahaemolyticus TaxID=670 RepID=UPI00215FEFBE|nr:hypothetical protein [Vibrio parahaemolyticus]MCS0114898.1 hypothetical protein [Vibrio parahaemolyticus]